ncbi:MAG: CoA pyrophosphatase [Micavibrio sp.]|nr:CoA pyrophosphatase [Micavibrio sp.]
MNITLKNIEDRLQTHQRKGAGNGDHALNPGMAPRPATREAAVLILLIPHDDGFTVLFTERTTTLSTHAGQVSFPGGGVEAADGGDLTVTALREAKEEIGLDPANARVLGMLDEYVTRTGFKVTPVVAVLEKDQQWTPQPDEVARIFEVPLDFIAAEGNLKREGTTFEGLERYFYALYHSGARIWGATAGMLKNFTEAISPPPKNPPQQAHSGPRGNPPFKTT